VLFLFLLHLHLFVLSGLLQAILNSAQKDKVKLPDVLLVSNGQVVAIVINNGGDDSCGVDVLSIGCNQSTKQLFQVINQLATGKLSFKLEILLHMLLDLLVLDASVLFRDFVDQDSLDKICVLEVCLQ
jgi:hypothetical protein